MCNLISLTSSKEFDRDLGVNGCLSPTSSRMGCLVEF